MTSFGWNYWLYNIFELKCKLSIGTNITRGSRVRIKTLLVALFCVCVESWLPPWLAYPILLSFSMSVAHLRITSPLSRLHLLRGLRIMLVRDLLSIILLCAFLRCRSIAFCSSYINTWFDYFASDYTSLSVTPMLTVLCCCSYLLLPPLSQTEFLFDQIVRWLLTHG